jgi:hypothetical protein
MPATGIMMLSDDSEASRHGGPGPPRPAAVLVAVTPTLRAFESGVAWFGSGRRGCKSVKSDHMPGRALLRSSGRSQLGPGPGVGDDVSAQRGRYYVTQHAAAQVLLRSLLPPLDQWAA